ncbi:hypothetical protein FNW02_05050 [Komarekiella sp. 'clone 1']|uniref:Uncharacterized protein n=1 Tax=Komarekiella delphini-convector SJRDD-AB1 TaxID=2593771 RepID=A0AA40SU06_9NOST|nr:hypothetical protein [Komarekiella delphini-convector]MBD6615231.1 hypothetical protein [Komarekiella delphini-convector SJRDD-AB1]
MSFIRTGMNVGFNFINKLVLTTSPVIELKQKNRVHDYSQFVWGSDYVFEAINGELGGYMTGQGKGIKPNDYIILQRGSKSYKYQVEEIDYYCDPPDMWMALLKQVLVEL